MLKTAFFKVVNLRKHFCYTIIDLEYLLVLKNNSNREVFRYVLLNKYIIL